MFTEHVIVCTHCHNSSVSLCAVVVMTTIIFFMQNLKYISFLGTSKVNHSETDSYLNLMQFALKKHKCTFAGGNAAE